MTPQSNFLVSDAIREGQVEPLRALLRSMNLPDGQVNAGNELLPFEAFDGLHYARFAILEANTAHEIREFGLEPYPWSPTLFFIGDIDGEREHFFAMLEQKAGPGLNRIFAHCESFADQSARLRDWMREHNVEPAVHYINTLGRTVRQVHENRALHESLSSQLPIAIEQIGRDDPRQLRQQLLTHVQIETAAGRLHLNEPAPTPWAFRLRKLAHLFGVPALLLLIAPLLLLATPFLVVLLRRHERNDPEIHERPSTNHLASLAEIEDLDLTNQFNVLGDVKPGWFRLFMLKAALLVLDYSVRHVYNRGYLTRVRTIHFARWAFLDNNRRLFFASNYDGSRDSYMDDFINKVAWGVNLVFSHGVGYPDTRWIIKGGAERELVYKSTLRRHQQASEVWYRAYPGSNAYDLQRDQAIREGVQHNPGSEAAVRQWLELIR